VGFNVLHDTNKAAIAGIRISFFILKIISLDFL